jgi:hypothetical protein
MWTARNVISCDGYRSARTADAITQTEHRRWCLKDRHGAGQQTLEGSVNTTDHTPSIAHRIRRYVAAASLIAFPALLVVEAPWIRPPESTGEVMFTAASDHAGALLASAVLLMLSGVLMVPAVGGLLYLARDRGAGLANLAAALGVLGGFGPRDRHVLPRRTGAPRRRPEPDGGLHRAAQRHSGSRRNRLSVDPLFRPERARHGLGGLADRTPRMVGPIAVTAVVVLHEVLPISIPSIEIAALGVLTVVFGYLGCGSPD